MVKNCFLLNDHGGECGQGASVMCSSHSCLRQFGFRALIAATLASGVEFAAQGTSSLAAQFAGEEPSDAVEHPAARTVGSGAPRLAFGIGDKLKLSFYERLDAEEDKWANRKRPTKPEFSFYLRTEISGDYTVQSDGTISLPLLGTFLVANRDTAELNAELTTAFERFIGRAGFTNVVLSERPPIYIIGPVKQPGVYKYEPGITVLHAVALAGGFDRLREDRWEDRWSVVEAVRESVKLGSSSGRLTRLLAQTSVLRAERDGAAVRIPDRLIELAGARGAEALVAEEEAKRAPAVKARDERQKTLSAAPVTAQRALEASRERLGPLNANIQMRKDRLSGLQVLNGRGSVDRLVLVQAQSELSDVEERRINALSIIAEAELRVSLAKQEEAKFRTDTRIELDREIEVREREIEDVTAALSAGAGTLRVLNSSGASNGRAPSEATIDFEIVRQTQNGPETIAAKGTTQLQPGDLVRASSR